MEAPRHGLLKKFSDSKWAWSYFLGPVYNRTIMKAADELYGSLVALIKPPDDMRLLDVGCGPGFFGIMLAGANPKAIITGVDFSPRQGAFANRNLERSGISNLRFIEGDAMDLPFEDASFDIVTSIFSIKYWPDPERGLREISRVLNPGGCFYMVELDRDFTDDEFDSLMNLVRHSLSWYYSYHLAHLFARRAILSQSVSVDEVTGWAASAGFSDVVMERTKGDIPAFSLVAQGTSGFDT